MDRPLVVAGGGGAVPPRPGEEALDQVPRPVEVGVVGAGLLAVGPGGITAVPPARARGRRTRSSAANASPAIGASAARPGGGASAPSGSCARPGPSADQAGPPGASTVAWIFVPRPP